MGTPRKGVWRFITLYFWSFPRKTQRLCPSKKPLNPIFPFLHFLSITPPYHSFLPQLEPSFLPLFNSVSLGQKARTPKKNPDKLFLQDSSPGTLSAKINPHCQESIRLSSTSQIFLRRDASRPTYRSHSASF